MIVRLNLYMIFFFCQWQILRICSETVHGCTINNPQRTNKTSVTLSCSNDGYILVQNLTFGVHKNSNLTCFYQSGDCTTRTTYIGLECNGLRTCQLDLNPQYLHICSQYSDYMVLDYLCLPGASLSICDHRLITTHPIDSLHRLFIRSPNYPNEYENSLNCSCLIKTNKATMKFLDFSLEERDEMNYCTRDYLQITSQTYCDSTIDQIILFNSSSELIFKSNDVITRKGFWLMIDSLQLIEVTCRNSFESPFLTSSMTTIRQTTLNTNTSSTHSKHRTTLSFILILIVIFVIVLLILNLLLMILCWKQRQTKDRIKSRNNNNNNTHRPFFCSKRSETSSASSITYGETSLDVQKRQTTSTTTATTGIYEDPNEVLTLQRQLKCQPSSSFYFQHGPIPKTFCPIVLPAGFSSIAPIHCHLDTSSQTFFPLDSQHTYETIQDGHYCPYQRLAATLRRQQPQQCTCYCTHHEHRPPAKTIDHEKAISTELNPETLV